MLLHTVRYVSVTLCLLLQSAVLCVLVGCIVSIVVTYHAMCFSYIVSIVVKYLTVSHLRRVYCCYIPCCVSITTYLLLLHTMLCVFHLYLVFIVVTCHALLFSYIVPIFVIILATCNLKSVIIIINNIIIDITDCGHCSKAG